MTINNNFLTQDQLSESIHISPRTLERMRVDGTGPVYTKLGRRVVYEESDIETWISENKFKSTSEYSAHCEK